MNKTYRNVSLFLFMLLLVFYCINLFDNIFRFSSYEKNVPEYNCLKTNTPTKSVSNVPLPENFETAYETILANPNEFALKYINLPYEYLFGSNSIPLAVLGYIGNGHILELGMVSTFFI